MARRKDRDERGAVAMIVAVTMVLVLVPLASLAIDIGYQRVAARDMQAVADVVAMDMARHLDGSSTAGLISGNDWDTALSNSLSRNDDQEDGRVVGPALTAVPCPPILTADLSPGEICAVPGIYEDGIFRRSGSEPATHVLVKARTEINYFFPILADKGSTAKEAIAEAPAGACFSIGSYAARVRSGNSPLLGPLLGSIDSDLNLDIGDYNALARVNVGLLDLLSVDTTVGTIDELIKADKAIGLSDFYMATATALAKNTANAAQAALLQSIAVDLPNTEFQLGDILNLDTGGASGLDAGLNVLDLVSAAAIAAGGTEQDGTPHAFAIPELKVNLGPLANVQAKAYVTEAPRIGCGRKNQAFGSTSQVGVNVAASMVNLDLGIARTKVDLIGSVNVAAAKGELTNVSCTPQKAIKVNVQDGLATFDLTIKVDFSAVLGLIPVVKGPIRVTGTFPTNDEVEKIIFTDADYDEPVLVGSRGTGIPKLSVDTDGLVGPLGVPIGKLSQRLFDALIGTAASPGLVNQILHSLDTGVVDPLLSTLGVQVSGADVFALREPKCGVPALRG